jgi:hypothetical protein
VADEALIVDRERARAQRGDEREPVGRVVDRGEHPDQVADLPALVEVAGALVPVGDSGVGERVLVVPEPGAGGHQDRHVAPPARPPRAVVVAVADLPPLAVRRLEQRCDRARLLAAELIGPGLRVELAEGEHDRRPPRARRARRLVEFDVAGLHTRLAREHCVEHGVERGEQLRVRAEVRRDLFMLAFERAVADLVVDRDVGAAEAVDRLLGVPDDREPARRWAKRPPVAVRLLVACEEQRELRLNGIGVLEFVDQHDPVAASEVVARRLVRAQQLGRPEQEVVEVGLAGCAPLELVVIDELLDPRQQAQHRVGAQPVLGGVVRVPVFLLECLQLLLALAPVRLRAFAEVRVGAPAVEQLELLLGLGAERLQLVGPLDDALGDLRAGVVAGIAADEQRPELVGDPAELGEVGCELAVLVCGNVERAQVAVLVDQLGRLADLVESEPAAERAVELGAARGQQLVLECLVRGVERQRPGESVDDVEQRVDPRLDRSLSQQRAGEAVDRLDVTAVQVPRRRLHALVLLALGAGQAPLERVADTGRELGGRLLRERDHDQLVHGRGTARERVRDPLDEHGRLPGARAGLDAEV